MHHHFLLLLLAATLIPSISSHNITRILEDLPEFSTFNHYLTITHLAPEINRRQTLTVLAVSNSAIAPIVSKHLPLPTLKNLLALHVLVDYFGAKKLHQITAGSALISTIFQSTGSATGMSGFVNITDHRGGRVSFHPVDSEAEVAYVKSIKEIPYNISVVQISGPLVSDAAEAPMPSVDEIDFVGIMAKKGCKTFADLITAGTGEIAKTFKDAVARGLTIFCPMDQAMKSFLPKFDKLTADQKTSLLLYHGIPIYNSMAMLKSSDGIVTTLATGAKSKDFNFTIQNEGEVVTLKTRVTSAKITGTLVDEDPLAVYTIDEVLKPRELFKPAKVSAPAPAPAPAAAADAPKGGKGKGKGKKQKKQVHASPPAPEGPNDGPAPGPAEEEEAYDEVADQNEGWRVCVARKGVVIMAVAVVVLMVA